MSIKHHYEQYEYAIEYVIPYLEDASPELTYGMREGELDVLEVGCAEGGFIRGAMSHGIHAIGLEIDKERIKIAKDLFTASIIFSGDITNKNLSDRAINCFDLIVMQDVIEHISDKETALKNVKMLLRNNGYLYITFPTKQSPFAEHQQNLKSALRYFPYLSYFPEKVIRFAGKLFKERDSKISEIVKNKYNAVDKTLFEKKCLNMGFKIIDSNYYFSRPIFKLRYNLPTIKAFNHSTIFGAEYLLRYSPL